MLFTFMTAGLFAFSVVNAHNDKTEKKSKTTDRSCCAQKTQNKTHDVSGGQDVDAKKSGMKHCEDMEAIETKDAKDGKTMNCCVDHLNAEAVQTKNPDTRKQNSEPAK